MKFFNPMIRDILLNIQQAKINAELYDTLATNFTQSKICLQKGDLKGALSAIYKAQSEIKKIAIEYLYPKVKQIIDEIFTFYQSIITQNIFNLTNAYNP